MCHDSHMCPPVRPTRLAHISPGSETMSYTQVETRTFSPECQAAGMRPLGLPGTVSARNGRGSVFYQEPWGERAQQGKLPLLCLLLGAGRGPEARPALRESAKIKRDNTELQDLAGVP